MKSPSREFPLTWEKKNQKTKNLILPRKEEEQMKTGKS